MWSLHYLLPREYVLTQKYCFNLKVAPQASSPHALGWFLPPAPFPTPTLTTHEGGVGPQCTAHGNSE